MNGGNIFLSSLITRRSPIDSCLPKLQSQRRHLRGTFLGDDRVSSLMRRSGLPVNPKRREVSSTLSRAIVCPSPSPRHQRIPRPKSHAQGFVPRRTKNLDNSVTLQPFSVVGPWSEGRLPLSRRSRLFRALFCSGLASPLVLRSLRSLMFKASVQGFFALGRISRGIPSTSLTSCIAIGRSVVIH